MTVDEEIFRILDKKFPGEFKLFNGLIFDNQGDLYDPEENIEIAFCFAEKLNLFQDRFLTYDEGLWIVSTFENKQMVYLSGGQSISQAVCDAIIVIHGDK